jgi:hypothetical protein
LSVLLSYKGDVIELAADLNLIGGKRPRLSPQDETFQPCLLVSGKPLQDPKRGVMLIEQSLYLYAPSPQPILSHRNLIGVDHVKARWGDQLLHLPAHRQDLFPHDNGWTASEQADQDSSNVAQPTAPHRDSMDSFQETLQMRHILPTVVSTHKGKQGHLMACSQVTQDIISPDLGS